jgi:hypothetical protein
LKTAQARRVAGSSGFQVARLFSLEALVGKTLSSLSIFKDSVVVLCLDAKTVVADGKGPFVSMAFR